MDYRIDQNLMVNLVNGRGKNRFRRVLLLSKGLQLKIESQEWPEDVEHGRVEDRM
jgi:hypothetical protein